jgi:23S rRNA (adenine2030-N6)-methyltransferase
MNYQHIFHSGNFADICKHFSLSLLLSFLQKKPQGFCYLDTHAGFGCYDLKSSLAQRSQEYKNGMGRLWSNGRVPELFADYCAPVMALNPELSLRWYAGSPEWVHYHLRDQDRMILIDSELAAIQSLKTRFDADPRVIVQQGDGYHGIKSFIAQLQKRSLILIDPPYEQANEQVKIIDSVRYLSHHCRQAVVAIWYPLKQHRETLRFYHKLKKLEVPKILASELCIYPDDNQLGLNGSGFIVLNPPWQFAEALAQLLNQLLPYLSDHPKRRCETMWLSE